MRRTEAWALSLLFVAMLAIPIVLFITGLRPAVNQNRPAAPLPTIDAAGVLDRDLAPKLDKYLEDALIVGPAAVKADAWIDIQLGDSPSDKVALGRDGWLFYTLSLDRPCLSPDQLDWFSGTITRAERVVEATGRNLIVALAPDKATIYPEFLSEAAPCVQEIAGLISDLDTPDSLVTVWDEMRLARSDSREIYFKLDTHWTNAGASVLAQAVVDTLQPGSWDGDAVAEVAIDVDHEGDLTVLLGLPSSEPSLELETRLTGHSLTEATRELFYPSGVVVDNPVSVDTRVTGNPGIPGATLVLHDSFGWALTPMIAPYFESAAIIAETNTAAPYLAAEIRGADTIIHVSVQRSLHDIMVRGDLAEGFVSALVRDLPNVLNGEVGAGESIDVTLGPPPDSDVYVVIELGIDVTTAEATVGRRTETLTPDRPRVAIFVGNAATIGITSTDSLEYQVVAVPRD